MLFANKVDDVIGMGTLQPELKHSFYILSSKDFTLKSFMKFAKYTCSNWVGLFLAFNDYAVNKGIALCFDCKVG